MRIRLKTVGKCLIKIKFKNKKRNKDSKSNDHLIQELKDLTIFDRMDNNCAACPVKGSKRPA